MHHNLLTQTLTALADANVNFVVCGGVACILQGVGRTTHDLDIRVDLEDADLRGVLKVAEVLGFNPRIPEPLHALLDGERRRVWMDEKKAVVYTLMAPNGAFSIDIFLQYPLTVHELLAEADSFVVEGRNIRVSSKRHLVAAKQAVQPPRKQDLRDIEDLLDLMHG